MHCNVLVVGLGAVGSAVTYQAARRGADVIGIDQYTTPHDMGSSHGESRITHLAMGDGEPYATFARRSFEIWRQIEAETCCHLLTATGGLLIGPDCHDPRGYANQAIAFARRSGVPHAVLGASEIRKRFSVFHVSDSDFAYFEPAAGMLRPERCIETQLSLARRYGARIRTEEQVKAIERIPNGVRVITARDVITAAKVVLAVGPWIPKFLPRSVSRLFQVYRQVQFWFAPIERLPENLPVFIWELRGNRKGIYGLPGTESGVASVKVASEQYETLTTAEQFESAVSFDEITAMRANFVQPFLPTLDGEVAKTVACMYTMTPDTDFVIDDHPTIPGLIVASPCSGHGFKHSAAVGEAIAERVLTGTSSIELTRFGFQRFGL